MTIETCSSLQPSEKSKYDQVFNSLGPVNDMLGGDKVKPVSAFFFFLDTFMSTVCTDYLESVFNVLGKK